MVPGTADLVQALDLAPGELLAVAGAGGKSTFVRTLGRQAVARGWRVLLTATTRLGWDPHEGPAWQIDGASPSEPMALLAALRARPGTPGLLALLGPHDGGTRHRGLPVAWPGLLAAARDPIVSELVLVECDGARQRALKWPAAHEPLVPEGCTRLIVCLGLAAFDAPLDDAHVHRSAAACQALGVPTGTRIDAELLRRWLLHPDGYLARVPHGAQAVVFANQVTSSAHGELLERLAPALLERWDRVLAGSAAHGQARVWARS